MANTIYGVLKKIFNIDVSFVKKKNVILCMT